MIVCPRLFPCSDNHGKITHFCSVITFVIYLFLQLAMKTTHSSWTRTRLDSTRTRSWTRRSRVSITLIYKHTTLSQTTVWSETVGSGQWIPVFWSWRFWLEPLMMRHLCFWENPTTAVSWLKINNLVRCGHILENIIRLFQKFPFFAT